MKKTLLFKSLLVGAALLALSCKKKSDEVSAPSPYLLGVGITTSSGTSSATVNYVIKANSLTGGTLSPLGNGLTLVGYRDYAIGNKTVFAVGGFADANVNGIDQDGSGNLNVTGTASFTKAADDIQQVDNTLMLAIKLPGAADGDKAIFNFVDINTKMITKTYSAALSPLVIDGNQPVYTGMAVAGSKLYVSYYHFDKNYKTPFTDTNYVAVYSYPVIAFERVIKDVRTGPAGAFGTRSGLFKTENGDVYTMSSSNLGYGFTKSTKPGGFLRIKSGATEFDAAYFFNTDLLGGKVAHIKYLGNNLLFATISTLDPATPDQWGDKKVKMAIINISTGTVTDVKLAGGTSADLIHDGNGGRSFPVLADNGKVYYAANIGGVLNVYTIDVATATAAKGATVAASFVGGIFKVL